MINYKVRVWGGSEPYIPVAPNKDVELIVSRIKEERADYKIEILYKQPWEAPIKKGEFIANLVIKKDGKLFSQYPLYTAKSINKASFIQRIYDKFLHLLGI